VTRRAPVTANAPSGPRSARTPRGHKARWCCRQACLAIAVSALPCSLALGASSTSFQIPNGTVDVAGGKSTSPSFALTACVGSEIAGSSGSSSYRIDSGCGAGFKSTTPSGPGPSPSTAGPQAIPALSGIAAALLATIVCLLALRELARCATSNPVSSAASRPSATGDSP
jgi:hypothetical protein